MSEISSIDIGLLGPGNTSYRDPGTDGQPGGRREPDEHLKDRLFGTILTARNLTRLSKGPGRFAPWCVEHGRTALRGAAGTLGRGTFHDGTLRRRDHKVTPDASCRTGPGAHPREHFCVTPPRTHHRPRRPGPVHARNLCPPSMSPPCTAQLAPHARFSGTTHPARCASLCLTEHQFLLLADPPQELLTEHI